MATNTPDNPGRNTGSPGRDTPDNPGRNTDNPGRNTAGNVDGATAARTTTGDDHAMKDSVIGTDQRSRPSNVSWGAIFAGVVTFIAVTVLMGMIAAATGLGGSGTAAGVWSVVALVVALAAAGYVAGALAVKGGLIHGFLTWAASLVAGMVLLALLGSAVLGAVGGALGSITSAATDAVSGQDVGQAVEGAQENIDQEDVDQAQEQAGDVADQAQEVAGEAADTAQTGAWWGFAGLLLGAVIASLMGMVGARSVHTRDDAIRTR